MYSCETVWVKVLLSKGWMVAVRNYSTNTIMEKNKQRGKGGWEGLIFRAKVKNLKIFLE